MSEQQESQLLLDLTSLTKKYGILPIVKLSLRLRQIGVEEGVDELAKILLNSELLIKAINKSTQQILDTSQIEKMVNHYNESGEYAISNWIRELMTGKILHSNKEISSFARLNLINVYNEIPRDTLAFSLINQINQLPKEKRKQTIAKSYKTTTNGNSLENWASIILENKNN